MKYRLVNGRTRRTVATEVELAMTRETRRRGLLGRESLEQGAALFIKPCFAIHTAFMKFPIDVVFVDGDVKVVRVIRDLKSWRIAVTPRARAVIELRGGTIDAAGIALGDSLYLAPAIESEAKSA